MGKRQREADKARKMKDKTDRRARRKEEGPQQDEIVYAEDIVGNLPSIDQAMHAIDNPDDADRSAATIPSRLFVGGLSWGTTQDVLRAAFADHGRVQEAVIVTDRDTGSSRGFGFVTMADRKDAQRAIKALDGSDLEGRTIAVNVATERQR